jgi:hypothetical protein
MKAENAPRKPAQSKSFGPIVTKDGAELLVTWDEAVAYCKSQKAHLPTAREYLDSLKSSGIRSLERNEVTTQPPPGFYLVDSINEDGSRDGFYMNHSGYQRPANLVKFHLLWTASTPPGHADYAHVFYDEWGGGGGKPHEHKKTYKNSFQCVLD